MNYQSKEEAQFKHFLIKQLLQNGYKRYAHELKDYYINFTDDPSIIAAIDSKNYVVYINRAHMYDNPDTLSMLIRHELLHSFLNHTNREIRELAVALGYNPDKITKIEFENVMKAMAEPNIAYRRYNAARSGNIAGDLDLSRYYIEKDKELIKDIGGLLLDDHPEWLGMSFEEIRKAVTEEGNRLKYRMYKKAFGNLVDENNFEIDSEEESEFSSNIISVEDIKEISIPSFEEAKLADRLGMLSTSDTFWLRDPVDEKNFSSGSVSPYDCASVYWRGLDDLRRYREITDEAAIIPILKIKNADLYTKVQAGEEVECLGEKWKLLKENSENNNPFEANTLFYTAGALGRSPFDKAGIDNDYMTSDVKAALQAWLGRQKRIYS